MLGAREGGMEYAIGRFPARALSTCATRRAEEWRRGNQGRCGRVVVHRRLRSSGAPHGENLGWRFNYMRLDNKVALVTGAAAGIGAAIAERFVEAGAAVVVFDINAQGARQVAQALSRKGRALAIHGNVACEEDVQIAVARTVVEFGALDVLVNNAGIELTGRVVDLPAADWDRQLGVNLKGVFLFCKYAIPHLAKRGGAIVNISSVHAFVSYAGTPAYDAAKAGVIALTRALALDHGREGIRANAICPGYIDTSMLEAWVATQPDPEATREQVLSLHPSGRIGTPRDVAEAALFLASDAAAFISGTYLVVDGAMTAAGR
jgi:NAD(P)-dependent dehydrogenase (short-subunit alcohol dehydrogenase family)